MINRPYIIFYQHSIYYSLLYRAHPLLRDFREATPGDVLRLYVSRRFKCLPHPYCMLYAWWFFFCLTTTRVCVHELNRTRSKMHENFSQMRARTLYRNFRSHRKCEREKKYTSTARQSGAFRILHTQAILTALSRHRGNKPLLTLYRWCYYFHSRSMPHIYSVYVCKTSVFLRALQRIIIQFYIAL